MDTNASTIWTNVANLTAVIEYNSESDYTLYEDFESTPVKLTDGEFAILFFEDAHKPRCQWENVLVIKKIVIKIDFDSYKKS